MNLLLHVCCAPCLVYPAQWFSSRIRSITGLFYNPNIHPLLEYQRRLDTLKSYSQQIGFDLVVPEYDPQQFFIALDGQMQLPKRCSFCWKDRLFFTAQYAHEHNFEFFSTTLLVSPYQDHDMLKRIGEDAAGRWNVKFWYEDFRPGYHEARLEAQSLGLYRQKYCGCLYSESERKERKSKNASAGTR